MQDPFDGFLSTRRSRRALAAVRDLVEARPTNRLVLLHGPPGVGKTHLLRAAVSAARTRRWSARDVTACDLVREIVDGLSGRIDADGDLLAIDDLHVLTGLPMTQREVGRLLAIRVHAGTRVLAAAGADLDGLADLVDRLRGIERTESVAMGPPDACEMRRLLLSMSSRAGIGLDSPTAATLAPRCRGDVRRAQGAIARLRLLESMRQGTAERPA